MPATTRPATRVRQAAGREQPLDDQVIGTVRGGREEGAAYEAAPEGVEHVKRGAEVEGDELALLPGTREPAHPAREPGRDHQRRDPAQQIDAELDDVDPDTARRPPTQVYTRVTAPI